MYKIVVIELACGEYGEDKIETLITASQNGRNLQWFDNPKALKDAKSLRGIYIEKQMNQLFHRKINKSTILMLNM